jgi:hypothetical protein
MYGAEETRIQKEAMAIYAFSLSLAHTFMSSEKDISQLSR